MKCGGGEMGWVWDEWNGTEWNVCTLALAGWKEWFFNDPDHIKIMVLVFEWPDHRNHQITNEPSISLAW